jgi:hypothetical protein
MSTDIVKISNKAYSISQTAVDRARRRKYFTTYTENAPNKLSNEEAKLLQDLGIDSKMITTLKLYLPTFFDNLHMCSSDTSMILHKNCNIPHYVLWSIMIANKEATDERLRQNRLKETTHQIGVAMNTAVIHQLRPTIDNYDTIFKLLVINPAPQPISLNVFRINEDPENSSAESSEPPPRESSSTGTEVIVKDTSTITDKGTSRGPRNLSDKESINRIFKLIISKPSKPSSAEHKIPVSNNNSEALSKQLIHLDESRRQPIYTFTQKGSTCASDALFTILLQADVVKRLFINNAEKIIRNALDNSLIHAIKRYINMLELESNHVDDRSRRKSINLTEKHGETILKTISESECPIGLTRTHITKYITNLQNKLLPTIPTIRNLFFFGGSEFKLNMENESVGKKNLNNISGFLITYPESSSAETKTGHAIAILKINGRWYISNNERGMLEEITDPKFMPILFYKLYNTVDGEIFQLYTRYNNMYKFRFNFAGGYIYPNSGMATSAASAASDIVSIVDSKRIIVFGENSENSENDQLTNIYKRFNQTEVDFKTYLESVSLSASAASGGDRIPGGIFGGDDENW